MATPIQTPRDWVRSQPLSWSLSLKLKLDGGPELLFITKLLALSSLTPSAPPRKRQVPLRQQALMKVANSRACGIFSM